MTEQFKNNAVSTLAVALDASTTSVVVVDASKFPTTGTFRVIVDDEIMLVTSVSGSTLTATRGYEGTTAVSHIVGTGIAAKVTAGTMTDLQSSIPAAQVPSDWNATTGVAAISNKPTNLPPTTGVNGQVLMACCGGGSSYWGVVAGGSSSFGGVTQPTSTAANNYVLATCCGGTCSYWSSCVSCASCSCNSTYSQQSTTACATAYGQNFPVSCGTNGQVLITAGINTCWGIPACASYAASSCMATGACYAQGVCALSYTPSCQSDGAIFYCTADCQLYYNTGCGGWKLICHGC